MIRARNTQATIKQDITHGQDSKTGKWRSARG